MRTLALVSGGLFLLAAAQQASLPAPLARHYATLAAAPSLTVEYTVRTVGEAPSPYKLVLSRPGQFRLTTPDGYVVSDGKTVTTYKVATKTYMQEAYGDAWLASFSRRPEVLAWSAFLAKEPEKEVVGARAGAARRILGSDTTEVSVSLKKSAAPATFYLDNKLGIARGVLVKDKEKEILVTASKVEVGKEPEAATLFAFVAPEGSTKEEPPVVATFAGVQSLINDRCLPCHAGANPRAGIGLSDYQGIAAIVVPGDPAGSLLVKAVKGDGVKKMPLGNHPALNAAEIALLETWIKNGAKQE